MIAYPESLNFALNFFNKGERFTYLVALVLLIINIANYYQLTCEAKIRNLSKRNINIVKMAMSLNVIVPTTVFLSFMRIDLAKEILMASVLYSLSVYYVETRVSREKT